MNLQITGNNMNGSPEFSLSGGNITIFAWSPFGGGSKRTGNAASLPGFNGERQDPLSGVTHLGNGYRAYSPALRRFTCPDNESPFGEGGINPYVYCDHDPINNTDPSGHMPKGEIVAGAVTRKREEAIDITPHQAESLPVSLSQPTQETTGTASAAAAASGYSSEVV
ncbi:TPA: RHS repeat-associated core domain-containing protein, partial [Salmonella enterica subsp. houtenae]|nr:RHS repeat-associated core domain-containing protein [Salmonella enterica subsp. houtenae]